MASERIPLWTCLLVITLSGIIGAQGQAQSPVILKEGGQAKITLNIPDFLDVPFFIKINTGDEVFDLLTVFLNSVVVFDAYSSRMKASLDMNTRILTVQLDRVEKADAGYLECFQEVFSTKKAENCGRTMIILRKPGQPTIKVLESSSVLVGERTVLTCETESRSLPVGHGLPHLVWWMDSEGSPVSGGQRISVNGQSQLEISSLERADAGLKFQCVTADDAGGSQGPPLKSDPSKFFEVQPEYAPTQEDLVVTPYFEDGLLINNKIGAPLNYSCSAKCNPTCQVHWNFTDAQGKSYMESKTQVGRSSLVKNGVNKWDKGTYTCVAENRHSQAPVMTSFRLQVLYLELMEVTMNDEQVSKASVWEGKPMDLKCVFDADPGPTIDWRSPAGEELLSEVGQGPTQVRADSGVLSQLYTSELRLPSLACEESGIYACYGNNGMNDVEGSMDVQVYCSPTPANIPGKTLQEEYVWEIPHSLTFEFVMKGSPAPTVKRIWSSNNDNKKEIEGEDVIINTSSSYDAKPWLTLFRFTTRRPLTLSDSGRTFTITFETSNDVLDYQFRIRHRGPPHEVKNLTLVDIKHDSVKVFWMPGFDGGEVQTFTVEYGITGEDGESPSALVLAGESIPENEAGLWVELEVSGLRASMGYTFYVTAFNTLGNATSSVSMVTAAAPSGGLSAGAVVGIVFAVLIFLFIVAVLIYWFWVRKQRERRIDAVEKVISTVREKLEPLIHPKEKKSNQNGDVASSKPKNPIVKMKKFLNRPPKKSKPDYHTVPVRDNGDDDGSDEFDEFEGEYVNTDEIRPAKKDEVVYANASAISHNEEKKKNYGREKNADGLIYVTVDLPNNNKPEGMQNNNNSSKPSGAPPQITKPTDTTYSDIDFSKMPLKDGMRQEVTAEVNPTLKDEDVLYDNVGGSKPAAVADNAADTDTSAEDGGADVVGGRTTTPSVAARIKVKNEPVEADFGTAV